MMIGAVFVVVVVGVGASASCCCNTIFCVFFSFYVINAGTYSLDSPMCALVAAAAARTHMILF